MASLLPKLSDELEAIALRLKTAHGQEECLREAYNVLTSRFRGCRIKTYTRFFDLLSKNIEQMWQKPGFLHCTRLNYLLKILLVQSGWFKPEQIQTQWTLVWYISPHQYLSVTLSSGRKVAVDMWAKTYGVDFGSYARGFNSSVQSID